MQTLFLYLNAFSVTGGIEKFNKAFMKALDDISVEKKSGYRVLSAYDDKPDEMYIPPGKFKGYKGSRISFVFSAVEEGIKCNKIFISHINLSLVGLIIKMFNPRVKIFLSAHGIEIWNKVSIIKKYFFKKCDYILAVSSYTKKRITETHNYPADRILIFPNTLDPYFNIPGKFEKPRYLIERYSFNQDSVIILAVTRIKDTEGFKGYDKVISVLPDLIKEYPGLKYILAGKYEQQEFNRVKKLIKQNNVEDHVILPGYIKDEELTDHYLLADLFVMPSKKEGFGIVFIEALACGLPVIAGNKDGSVDALKNGELGTLIDPDDTEQLKTLIINNLDTIEDKEFLSSQVQEAFGFEKFKERLKEIIES